MSYFLFEKQQVNCNCFDSTPHSARRIFRSQSYNTPSNKNHDKKELSVRNGSQNAKNKKKSLKKQKPYIRSKSTKDQIHLGQPQSQFFDSNFIISQHVEQKIVPQIANMDDIVSNKVDQLKTGQSEQNKMYRTFRGPVQKMHQPICLFSQKQIVCQKDNRRDKNFYENYDQKVIKQFQKDFQAFQKEMNNKNSNLHSSKYKQRKKSLSANKLSLQPSPQLQRSKSKDKSQIQIFSQIYSIPLHMGPYSQRGNGTLSKRDRNTMVLKQTQSQKDGSSSDSDKQSQVVGRGWDNENVADLSQLQDLTKKKYLKTQTMVTQQSNIRSSQIKTGTQFSNSMISPKSQKNIGLKFGGMHKYGQTGMSYQNIDDFLLKQKEKQKFKFKHI